MFLLKNAKGALKKVQQALRPNPSREYRSSGRNLGQHIQSVDGRGNSEAGSFSILDSHH